MVDEKDIIETVRDSVLKYGMIENGDRVVVAVGNRPDNRLFNQVEELGIEVYQIGDCLEVRSAKEAIYEAAVIGRKI